MAPACQREKWGRSHSSLPGCQTLFYSTNFIPFPCSKQRLELLSSFHTKARCKLHVPSSALSDRQCLTWLHRVSCTHPQLPNTFPSQRLPLASDPAMLFWCHTSHRTLPATGGEVTKPISVMFFPKYFTKVSTIPSEQAIRACTTAQLLIPVWSRTMQAHGAGRPGKTLVRPQSTQQSISPCTLPGDVKLHWSIVPEQLYLLTSRELTKTP